MNDGTKCSETKIQRKKCYLPDDALLSLGSTVRTQTAREATVVTVSACMGTIDAHIALLIVHVIVRQVIARVHRVVDVILRTTVAVRITIGTIVFGA